MTDESDYHIDIVSPADGDHAATWSQQKENTRPWVGIHFECCGVYTRIYRHADSRTYQGYCPQCGRRVTLSVGPDGVNARIFRATPVIRT